MRKRGIVKWWSNEKGYGFITPDDGSEEIFCHFTGIKKNGPGKRNLSDGQLVEFDVVQNEKGWMAADVTSA